MGVGSKAFINTCDNAFDNFSVSLHIWIAKTEVKINVWLCKFSHYVQLYVNVNVQLVCLWSQVAYAILQNVSDDDTNDSIMLW